MPRNVEIPGIGIVEFPDSMSESDVQKESQKLYLNRNTQSGKSFVQGTADNNEEALKGVLKGAGRTALFAGKLVQAIPGVKKVIDAGYGIPGYSDATFKAADAAMAPANDLQRAGGYAEGLAEAAIPIGAAVDKIPRFSRAAGNFQSVMGAAENVPADLSKAGSVALRIQELADRGATMPSPVRKFLNRVTDPEKPAMAYRELRDWASNISKLSAKDWQSVNAVMGKEIGNLRMALNEAAGQAASVVGKGEQYAGAMKEYAQAAKLKEVVGDVAAAAKRYAIPGGIAAGAGYFGAKTLRDLLMGDR